MEIKLVDTFDNSYLDTIYKTYQSVGWLNHNKDNIESILKNSTHNVFAIHNSKVIGIGRALSDGVFNAAIYDVIVRPEYQNLKIGSRIVNDLLEQIGDVSCIHLISTTGKIEFYNKQGFKKLKTAMAIYQSEKLKMAYTE
ncbi:GNAT family N-acetyltransferase [Staphylococcus intermedius]|uniref:GNAT family acetyltransferase n=1 Tax=Staphylococcus intermedius NCTC 11048 TaxID=1141106 RepID=A0A380G6Y4_STAIN|nr:GNAT family N-acetyltransferase [Staphylococcus intermedius]PCF63181.1 N-acetyltransferase [Staphylococcus intermedius]PCF78073.1 N-acetyltransferase [Staphylococcus intermedius]PCF79158.1 N-acetyltransferase [Staphylococcus intermedius]PCF85457.1 N-acetyltransferase [Staphylococcus intermedius]PCF86523.1 N-acetyltransferase [Staphylococcus intermedius]